jgi:WD40 repeat protein
MSWNRSNRDLLAVGYGPHDYAGSGDGAAARGTIALWSISNPEYPQALLKTPDGVGVTAIDFSTQHPNLLAAGLYDGSIAVYDVKRILQGASDGGPGIVSDKLQPGAHTEAVWQVKWVTKPDTGEVLVSISTDGRITEWSTKKGLTPTPLMTLKRARGLAASALETGAGGAAVPPAAGAAAGGGAAVGAAPGAAGAAAGAAAAAAAAALPRQAGGEALGAAGSEGLLSRTASGLCFDFLPEDPSQYFAGTEDGLVARCSTSYSEQYLDIMSAHAGPVNRIRVSPYMSHALLTASSDWTVKLWNMAAAAQPLVFSTDDVNDAVADVVWSPAVSTRFASVTRDGHIQVWDARQVAPVIDAVVAMDRAEWEATLAAAAAARAAEDQRRADEEKRRRRAAGGAWAVLCVMLPVVLSSIRLWCFSL